MPQRRVLRPVTPRLDVAWLPLELTVQGQSEKASPERGRRNRSRGLSPPQDRMASGCQCVRDECSAPDTVRCSRQYGAPGRASDPVVRTAWQEGTPLGNPGGN